ncbi:hypothetical protein J8F10_05415 [Gemmata sp. G18]|uniref:Uncharacterized protein n=1 Tax=Gemmata palustris TaxID=2822762 RepID=A0ABS5BLZ7_9BACT|nr:hypothetical protein [Gemmata palustris]MBP3954722.1 hypothetical protein [Gemmata palustris]
MNPVLKMIAAVALLSVPTAGALVQAAPAKDGDPVLVGTVWKGKLTQKGEFKGMGGGPPEFDCALTVTKRDGEKFEADLVEKTDELKVTYLVRGTIALVDKDNKDKGYKIEFESVGSKDVENTEAITKIPYTGTVKDMKLKGTWKYPANEDGTTLEGTFEFELTKKD